VTDANSQSQAPQPFEVSARALPMPETVSPGLQRMIGAPSSGHWNAWLKAGNRTLSTSARSRR
jgi:hypothetical protein